MLYKSGERDISSACRKTQLFTVNKGAELNLDQEVNGAALCLHVPTFTWAVF